MDCMSLLGFSACTPDLELRESLPFPVFDIDKTAMPAMLRRRSSSAMQLAFSAATAACAHAQRSPSMLPSIFASVAGEIQTTDLLCTELVKPDGVISPSAFHNSVQNTAAGYWCIAQHCMQSASALAAGADTFAMALLEAWCQLSCQGGELLVVCYDEQWPDYLDSARGKPAFACALVLAAGIVENSLLQIGRPQLGQATFPVEFAALANAMPILSSIPLLRFATIGGAAQNIAVCSNQFFSGTNLGGFAVICRS